MISALVVFYFIVAFCLIVLVLLQDPKGNGAIFGGGGSQSLFGATGATSFIVKATRVTAILFAICVIGINYMLMSQSSKSAVYDADSEIATPLLETDVSEVEPTPDKTDKMDETDKTNKTDDTDKTD